jgi:predicted DNA-binding WGR domain protein
MKKIWIMLLLASLVSSCGPSRPLNYFQIEFQDHNRANYYLLSSQDTAVVASSVDNPKDSVELIPLQGIRRMFYQRKSTAGNYPLNMLNGYRMYEIDPYSLEARDLYERATVCGIKSESQKNRVRLQFRDSVSHEYYLLSVRDSGLVVIPGYYDRNGPAQIIPFANLERVYYHTNGKLTGALLGGAIGGVAALGAVLVIAKNEGPGQIQGSKGMAFAALSSLIGASAITLGIIIGVGLSKDEKSSDISSAHDRDVLREYSKFPDYEPPELQKIK